VPWEKIRECSLDVMVMDFDNIGRNELIGRILLAGEFENHFIDFCFSSPSRFIGRQINHPSFKFFVSDCQSIICFITSTYVFAAPLRFLSMITKKTNNSQNN
jgi:hypothetical protein